MTPDATAAIEALRRGVRAGGVLILTHEQGVALLQRLQGLEGGLAMSKGSSARLRADVEREQAATASALRRLRAAASQLQLARIRAEAAEQRLAAYSDLHRGPIREGDDGGGP